MRYPWRGSSNPLDGDPSFRPKPLQLAPPNPGTYGTHAHTMHVVHTLQNVPYIGLFSQGENFRLLMIKNLAEVANFYISSSYNATPQCLQPYGIVRKLLTEYGHKYGSVYKLSLKLAEKGHSQLLTFLRIFVRELYGQETALVGNTDTVSHHLFSSRCTLTSSASCRVCSRTHSSSSPIAASHARRVSL